MSNETRTTSVSVMGPVVPRTAGERTSSAAALLRDRLRAITLTLIVAFILFSTRHYYAHSEVYPWTPAAVLVLVLAYLRLRAPGPHRERDLRRIELVMVATVLLHFVAKQRDQFITSVLGESQAEVVAQMYVTGFMFFSFIATYCLFVPNTPRRAALVVVPFVLTPVAMLWYASGHSGVQRRAEGYCAGGNRCLSYRPVGDADWERAPCAFENHIGLVTLFLFFGGGSALFGVYTMDALRQRARRFSNYQLVRELGHGGMGEVWLAKHLLLKRPCAIKMIRTEKAEDETALERFRLEVEAMARLTHWNTVEVYDYGTTNDGAFYYAMEYLSGKDLKDLVDAEGPLPAGRAIHLLRQVCAALAEAHGAGLVHRDIKPSNIMVTRRGGVCDVVKLLDFGLVKEVNSREPELTGDVSIGTPEYMCPEQARAVKTPDARGDLYSLGAVGYFLVTGRPPFVAASPVEVLIAHVNNEPAPPGVWNPGVPADLAAVLTRCLAKNPGDRYADAHALDAALAACADAGSWTDAMARAWWAEQPCDPDLPSADQGVCALPRGDTAGLKATVA